MGMHTRVTIVKSTPNYKKATIYQISQEGYQPKLIQSGGMMINRINYIHHNPVKRKASCSPSITLRRAS